MPELGIWPERPCMVGCMQVLLSESTGPCHTQDTQGCETSIYCEWVTVEDEAWCVLRVAGSV